MGKARMDEIDGEMEERKGIEEVGNELDKE